MNFLHLEPFNNGFDSVFDKRLMLIYYCQEFFETVMVYCLGETLFFHNKHFIYFYRRFSNTWWL
jgi:hypothetical protein